MTDKEITEALKDKINGSDYQCFEDDDVLDLIVRQRAEIKRLNYILWGVMHSVDKWLDGAELEQDEVNRAATMREKTLRIVEEKQEEIDNLRAHLKRVCAERDARIYTNNFIKSEAVKEFANILKNKIKTECNPYGKPIFDYDTSIAIMHYIDKLISNEVWRNW